MNSGLPLSPDSLDELNVISTGMIQRRTESLLISNSECEGEIRTKFEIYCVGSFTGFLFEARLETEEGRFSVRYLLKPVEIPANEPWIGEYIDVPDQFIPVSTMN
jgi:hypothetical protein